MSSASDIRAAIRTTCEPGGLLELHAGWGEKSGERALDVGDLPKAARSRAVALALAELLAGLRSPDEVAPLAVELEENAPAPKAAASAAPARPRSPTNTLARAVPPAATNAPPAPHTPNPKTPDGRVPQRDADPERQATHDEAARTLRPALAASVELRSFELQTNTEGVRLHYDFSGFGAGVAALFGRESGELGLASAVIVHGYAEKRLRLLGRLDETCLVLGPRAGAGVVQVRSTAKPGSFDTSVAEPYLDLAAFLELSGVLEPVRFGARVELGYALGLVALEDDNRFASYGGPFGGVLFDLGLVL